jgi:hypothetical protein
MLYVCPVSLTLNFRVSQENYYYLLQMASVTQTFLLYKTSKLLLYTCICEDTITFLFTLIVLFIKCL